MWAGALRSRPVVSRGACCSGATTILWEEQNSNFFSLQVWHASIRDRTCLGVPGAPCAGVRNVGLLHQHFHGARGTRSRPRAPPRLYLKSASTHIRLHGTRRLAPWSCPRGRYKVCSVWRSIVKYTGTTGGGGAVEVRLRVSRSFKDCTSTTY